MPLVPASLRSQAARNSERRHRESRRSSCDQRNVPACKRQLLRGKKSNGSVVKRESEPEFVGIAAILDQPQKRQTNKSCEVGAGGAHRLQDSIASETQHLFGQFKFRYVDSQPTACQITEVTLDAFRGVANQTRMIVLTKNHGTRATGIRKQVSFVHQSVGS